MEAFIQIICLWQGSYKRSRKESSSSVYFTNFLPARQPGEHENVYTVAIEQLASTYTSQLCSLRKAYFRNEDSIAYRIS